MMYGQTLWVCFVSCSKMDETDYRLAVTSTSSNLTHRASFDEHFPRTVAFHLRMGDYDGHCLFLNKWNVRYLSFPFPESLGGGVRNGDVFDPSPFLGPHTDAHDAEVKREAKLAYYMEHCLPTIPQVVKRLHDVRADYEADRAAVHGLRGLDFNEERAKSNSNYRLNKVYVLTNGKPEVIRELKEALLNDEWDTVAATPDLEGGWSKLENVVSGAIDMAIGERAEVFVGNGVSPLPFHCSYYLRTNFI